MERIQSPSWTGHKESSLRREPRWLLAPVFSSNVFQKPFPPLDAGIVGGARDVKITKRTQSKNGKTLLKQAIHPMKGLL